MNVKTKPLRKVIRHWFETGQGWRAELECGHVITPLSDLDGETRYKARRACRFCTQRDGSECDQ